MKRRGLRSVLLLTMAILAAVLLVGLFQVALASPSTQGPVDPTVLDVVVSDSQEKLSDADIAVLQEPLRAPPLTVPKAAAAVLWDNGPLVNSVGTGVGGADESVLQNLSLNMNVLGFGHQVSADNRIADDFEVTDAAGWTISAITFFAYQTGSTTASTMDAVNLRIWDGPPGDPGSSVVWGNTTTNLLGATGWTNIYRVAEDTTGAADNRPIMFNTAVVNAFLPQGVYWLDWQTGGTLSSGPWAPPITITGQATTGNGLQSTDGGETWVAAEDSRSPTQQGFPFVIEGDVGQALVPSISLDKTVVEAAGSCPGSDSITVAPGSQVKYCYEVTNTGTVSLTRHDLVDSELGTLALGIPYTLTPGSSTGAGTSGVTINTTTVNTATWTAYNPGPTDVASATDTAEVVVSGPAPLVCNGATVGFDAGIPLDWTVANNAAQNPVEWSNIAGCGESGNYTGGAGDAACASSDLQGGGSGLYDTELWTPPFSLDGVGSPMLTFLANYQNFAGVDFLDVDVSTDGGATWTTLLSWNEDHGSFRATPGEEVTVDLSAYVGEPNVIVRWHYYDPGGPANSQDWYAQVDDVALDCTVGPGIGVAKTVGTDPAVCATTDDITVVYGTEVYYCYEVTNTGTVDLGLHDLDDSELGSIFAGLSYVLTPGSSVNTVAAGLTVSAIISATTVNTATWTAYNPGPTDVATASDTASVTAITPVCPAGYNPVTVAAADFEGAFPPAGWTVANTTTDCVGVPEWTNTDPGGRTNLTGGTGAFAIADSDACGSGSVMNSEMWTSVMDLTGLVNPRVAYYTDYNDISSVSDVADLDFSIDGGVTWTNLISWNEDHRGPLLVQQDFPADNESNVLLRWNYTNATYDWWWQVDDVLVMACELEEQPMGARIGGHVFNDLNQNGVYEPWFGEPGIGGVTITRNGGFSTTSNYVNGWYGFYIPSHELPGTFTVTETQPPNHISTTPDSYTVHVEDGDYIMSLHFGEVPVSPSIEVAKTVGTDPTVCASTDEIDVVAGTEVYYCYTVTNTGDVTLDLHDLEDSELGTILDGFSFALAPGASVDTVTAGLTLSATIDATTVNTATWTAYLDPYVVASATASATVTVVEPSIGLAKTVGTDPTACATTGEIDVFAGTEVYYCYTVTNTGDVTLNLHDLEDSELGTILDNFSFALAPGASVDTVAAGLTLSATIDATTVNTATWTAYNDAIVTTTATDTAMVNVVSRHIYLPLVVRNE